MTASDRGIGEYSDIAGSMLRANNWLQRTRIPGQWEAALQAATNADLAFYTSRQPTVGAGTATGALYQSNQDILLATYQTVPGVYVQVQIPAPLGAFFLPGGVQVDFASAAWIALDVAIIANITDTAGNAALAVSSAVKTSRRSDYFNG